MTQEISALVFDAYGTLFDVHSVTRLAESLFPGKGAALSQAWRAKQLEYTWLRTLMGRYEDFSRVTAASLDWTFESLGLGDEEAPRRALIDEYRKLAMFPEVPAALETLGEGPSAGDPVQRASRACSRRWSSTTTSPRCSAAACSRCMR